MSIYRTFDQGAHGESNVYTFARTPQETHAPQPARAAASGDGVRLRRASPANEPFTATLRWVEDLPHPVRPLTLLDRYPRIANALANGWNDPALVRGYLFDLLIDHRGGRAGFPLDVQGEILALRAYFDDMHVHTDWRAAGRGR